MVGRSDGRMVAAVLTMVLVAFGAASADESPPGPENYLFKARISDNGMVVFLPEAEIWSREDAAEYLRWARETYPAHSSRIVAKWASEDVDLAVLRSADAALLKAGDAAIDFGGKVSFSVVGPAENGKFRLHLASLPAFGEADPGLCLTNVWVLSRNGLLERWRKALAADPDGAPAEVKKEIETVSGGGRYGREGGEIWRATVEDFSTNTPALWPRVRFENRTSLPVSMRCLQAKNTIAPGGEWRVAVKDPPTDGEVKFFARHVPVAPYQEEDYGWATNSLAWSRTAPADAVHVFNEPPGTLLPPPYLILRIKGMEGEMPPGLAVAVDYKGGSTETIKASMRTINGKSEPVVEIKPHVPVTALALMADGYEDSVKYNWGGRKEISLSCGGVCAVPIPNSLKKKEAALSGNADEAAPAQMAARPEVSPRQETPRYVIAPWPGESIGSPPPKWPWPDTRRRRSRIRVWWSDFKYIAAAEPGKFDYDCANALKRFNDRIVGEGEFAKNPELKNAYMHIACCEGCELCKPYRDEMAKVRGFEEQRWMLFQTLLLERGNFWTDHDCPPNPRRIQRLRSLLEEKETAIRKGKGK